MRRVSAAAKLLGMPRRWSRTSSMRRAQVVGANLQQACASPGSGREVR